MIYWNGGTGWYLTYILTFSDDLNIFREMFGSKNGHVHSDSKNMRNEAEALSASSVNQLVSIMEKLRGQMKSCITATQGSSSAREGPSALTDLHAHKRMWSQKEHIFPAYLTMQILRYHRDK